MMEHYGANVIAIEANRRAFLKCLIVKNALHMQSQFLYGDFRRYLESAQTGSFDFVAAVGVLYHMTEPLKLLYDIARVTDAFGVWTHFYDRSALESSWMNFDKKPEVQTHHGKSVEAYRQYYLRGNRIASFCGGARPPVRGLRETDCWNTWRVLALGSRLAT